MPKPSTFQGQESFPRQTMLGALSTQNNSLLPVNIHDHTHPWEMHVATLWKGAHWNVWWVKKICTGDMSAKPQERERVGQEVFLLWRDA